MSSELEYPNAEIADCVRLLHEAGLTRAEDIRRLVLAQLHECLAAANQELKLFAEPPGLELLTKIKSEAERKGYGEFSIADLHTSHLEALPADFPSSSKSGLAGKEDFRAWDPRQDQTTDGASLPGKEDFPAWRRDDDDV